MTGSPGSSLSHKAIPGEHVLSQGGLPHHRCYNWLLKVHTWQKNFFFCFYWQVIGNMDSMPIRKNKVFTVLRLLHDIRYHSTVFCFYCLCWGISYMSYCSPLKLIHLLNFFLAALKTFVFVDGFWQFNLMFLGVIFFVFRLLWSSRTSLYPWVLRIWEGLFEYSFHHNFFLPV